jgi:C-methyltransferase
VRAHRNVALAGNPALSAGQLCATPDLVTEPRYQPLPPPSRLDLTARRFPDAPPAGVVRALLWLRGAVSKLAKALGPAELCVFEQATAAAGLHVLGALVRAGVPEALRAGPLGAEQLAERTGLNADTLFRTLRCASQQGYFRLRRDGRFEHNSRSRVLCSGGLSRAREYLLYFGSGSNLAAWANFEHALKTGRNPFEDVHGMNVWEWFERHTDEREMFAHSMMGLSVADAPVIARLYPFREIHSVCDIGGGRGTLLSELLIRHAHLRGVLYERGPVLDSARPLLEARGVLNRVRLSPGDFFEKVPTGADAYLLKNVLHDWDDERCVAILRNVRDAAGKAGRVLIAESLLERYSQDPIAVPADLQMMVACADGRERSQAEFQSLLGKCGFELARLFSYPTISVLEGVPV